jgi:myo-inositol-1(or 4)-monophosphatase
MESRIVPADIMPFLDETIRRAGSAVLEYFRHELRITAKDSRPGAIDIVTDADRASEEIVLEAIRREFPNHDILTEESEIEAKGSEWLWLIDPLDGTVNFAHGYPLFCVSIALAEQGKLVAGMVYDPLRQEAFSAFRGAGAFLNGQPIRVSSAEQLNRSVVSTGFPYDRAFTPENNVAEFSTIVTKVQGIRRGGSAAIDLSYVACGRLDGFWELKLKPWDMAAGMLLVEEACGKVTDRTGYPTDFYTQSVVATNGNIHPILIALLAEAAEKAKALAAISTSGV